VFSNKDGNVLFNALSLMNLLAWVRELLTLTYTKKKNKFIRIHVEEVVGNTHAIYSSYGGYWVQISSENCMVITYRGDRRSGQYLFSELEWSIAPHLAGVYLVQNEDKYPRIKLDQFEKGMGTLT
jgi:hypothetical protein